MRGKIILLAVVILVVGLLVVFGCYGWFWQKTQRVAQGLARPTFPYSDYTVAELGQMFPQTLNENVATTQTPEETYNKLKNALEKSDVELASSLFFSRNRDQYIEIFNKAKKEGKLQELNEKLDETIEKMNDKCSETRCTYLINSSKSEVDFIKNSRGVWLIESL